MLISAHKTMPDREFQIITMKIDHAGVFLVNVGDHIFGLHRIVLSLNFCVEGEADLYTHSENTVYYLKEQCKQHHDVCTVDKITDNTHFRNHLGIQ